MTNLVNKADNELSNALEFRIEGTNIQFLDRTGERDEDGLHKLHTRAERPATNQERTMWRTLVDLRAEMMRLGDPVADVTGVDAYGVRNSLGDPFEGKDVEAERD